MHALLLCSSLFLASVSVPDAPAEPAYEFKLDKKDDSIAAVSEGKRTVFVVTSKIGIGGATIRLKAGQWPRDVTIRLKNFTMLESFAAGTDRLRFSGEMGTSSGGVKALSGKMPFHLPDSASKYQKDGPAAGSLDVRVEQNKNGIDIALPANLFVGSKEVRLQWVDAYRR